MKILHTVEFYHPSVGGAQEVVKQLSEHLVKKGHDVTVATTKIPNRGFKTLNGVKIKEFGVSGNKVRGFVGEVEKYRQFVKRGNFDIVTNFAAQQWATDALLPIISDIKAKKVFVPTGFSAFYDPTYKKYFNKMRTWMKEYDMNIFLSDNYRDINFARKVGIPKSKMKIIPNGASEEEFEKDSGIDIRKKLNIPNNHFLVLLVGSHTGLKGHKEALKIFSKAGIKNATLLIIGNSFGGGCTSYCKVVSVLHNKVFSGNRQNKVIITSLDRKDTANVYKEADIFLFPSNIECSPIVLFEACASKTPFLTTDVGNSREIVKWTGGGMILPTTFDNKGLSHAKIKESIEILKELYKDSGKRKKLAHTGYMNWKKKFTWEKISKQYEDLYFELLSVK